MLELRNGWYYDANNNRWNSDVETLESATKKSESLINCKNCSDCSRCSDFKENPQRYTTPRVGSRNAQTTIYWTQEKQQVVCGCFIGDLQRFEKRVKEVHATSEHLKPYLKQIKIMKYLIKINTTP